LMHKCQQLVVGSGFDGKPVESLPDGGYTTGSCMVSWCSSEHSRCAVLQELLRFQNDVVAVGEQTGEH
jgi:hypothetical protein